MAINHPCNSVDFFTKLEKDSFLALIMFSVIFS
jgi:hypothetical protein